jgi:hypothetical protein
LSSAVWLQIDVSIPAPGHFAGDVAHDFRFVIVSTI